jgi:hypothetical protein
MTVSAPRWTAATKAEALRLVRLLASYHCAGEPACDGQDARCGPCEAAAWLRVHDR